MKTETILSFPPQADVKTRKPFPFEQENAETFARCRKVLRGSADAKYTYFMRDGVSGLIKIGMSADPEARRSALSASGARSMEILLLLRDGNLEGCYHQHFADLRVEGEWFLPHPDIFAEIAQRIEARSDETPAEAVQPEGREPGGEAMRPDSGTVTQELNQ